MISRPPETSHDNTPTLTPAGAASATPITVAPKIKTVASAIENRIYVIFIFLPI